MQGKEWKQEISKERKGKGITDTVKIGTPVSFHSEFVCSKIKEIEIDSLVLFLFLFFVLLYSLLIVYEPYFFILLLLCPTSESNFEKITCLSLLPVFQLQFYRNCVFSSSSIFRTNSSSLNPSAFSLALACNSPPLLIE
jgi:hypothetical protein